MHCSQENPNTSRTVFAMTEITTGVGAGRYAPSPSGDLHIGNLRTAVLAWTFARADGKRFVLRIEDLDRVKPGAAQRQLDDLRTVGVDWDSLPLVQSEREEAHRAAVAELTKRGMTYECYCTRRDIQSEIAASPSAPHAAPGAYPGTCRNLSENRRQQRRRERPPAIRLRAQVHTATITDRLAGTVTAAVDDMVLLRNDCRPAYNLAVVLDDAFQGVDQVVRADDLLSSTPRQAHLAQLLGLPAVEYVHVPLVLNTAGQRLAKRDGAVTLGDLQAAGHGTAEVMGWIGHSLGLPNPVVSARDVLAQYQDLRLSDGPWTFRKESHG